MHLTWIVAIHVLVSPLVGLQIFMLSTASESIGEIFFFSRNADDFSFLFRFSSLFHSLLKFHLMLCFPVLAIPFGHVILLLLVLLLLSFFLSFIPYDIGKNIRSAIRCGIYTRIRYFTCHFNYFVLIRFKLRLSLFQNWKLNKRGKIIIYK